MHENFQRSSLHIKEKYFLYPKDLQFNSTLFLFMRISEQVGRHNFVRTISSLKSWAPLSSKAITKVYNFTNSIFCAQNFIYPRVHFFHELENRVEMCIKCLVYKKYFSFTCRKLR